MGGQSILVNGVYIHISPIAWLHEKQVEYLENCICLHYQIEPDVVVRRYSEMNLKWLIVHLEKVTKKHYLIL